MSFIYKMQIIIWSFSTSLVRTKSQVYYWQEIGKLKKGKFVFNNLINFFNPGESIG